jgi:hypothetical protein
VKSAFSCYVDRFGIERHEFPCPDNYFDLVLAAEIIEHMTHGPVWMLLEFRRVLADGGYLPNVADRIDEANQRVISGNIFGLDWYQCRSEVSGTSSAELFRIHLKMRRWIPTPWRRLPRLCATCRCPAREPANIWRSTSRGFRERSLSFQNHSKRNELWNWAATCRLLRCWPESPVMRKYVAAISEDLAE